jgi:sigma-B regulation protein RsbU (phosphoserine phosphatase)
VIEVGDVSEQRAAREAFLEALVYDDPVQLYERAPCGFLSTTPDGLIVKCNATLRTWLDLPASEIVGQLSFVDLLTRGSRIYHETHYAPTLLMQGSIREIAFDLVRADGSRLPVLVNATMDRDADGVPRVIRVAVFDATERRSYERELLRAKEQAEESEARARALARTLQQTLIPPLPPEIPRLQVAASYRPAGDGLQVGGDFYDVFPIGTDDWVVVLGDVQGKGVEAAVVAGLVRHTVRALTVNLDDPAEVLANVNDVLLHHGAERFCTAVVLRLRRTGADWQVVVGNGGHPAPVLVQGGGAPRMCGGSGQLLGILESGTFEEERLTLSPGDTLVLYTDGVTEGRLGSELYGDDRLLRALDGAEGDAGRLVDDLVADVLDFQDGVARDDIAVVAVRVPLP